jgi:hypothetical protein
VIDPTRVLARAVVATALGTAAGPARYAVARP